MAEKLSFDRQCRSEVWKHFEKKQIEGKLYSVCGRCGKKLRYFGWTSSMRAHWKTSHAAEALDEDGSGKGSQRGRNHQSSIAQFVQRARPPSNCPLWKVNGANDLLVRWCWTNLRPLDIVNDEGLRDFVKFLEPGYHLPSRTFVAKQLALRHQEGLDALQKVLQTQARAGVFITSDIWTSAATQAFNTTTVHFIDQVWRMKCFVLSTIMVYESRNPCSGQRGPLV